MAVRCYESVESFLRIAVGAGTDPEIQRELVRGFMPGTLRIDAELFGGRYFAVTDGNCWTVLEAQPSATAHIVADRFSTVGEARTCGSWLADGPYPRLLSTAAREVLSELSAAGHHGLDGPRCSRLLTPTFMLDLRERAVFLMRVRELRAVGFTVDQHVRRGAFKLHTPWAQRDGVWPEDWHTIRGLTGTATVALAEGFTAEEARKYLVEMVETDGRDELATVTVETPGGLRSALDFLAAGRA